MGGKWIQWNNVTGRYEYLHFRRGTKEVFSKAWTRYVEERAQWTARAGQPSAASGSGGLSSMPEGKKEDKKEDKKGEKKEDKTAEKKKRGGNPAEPGKVKRTRTTLDVVLADASKTKIAYQAATATGNNILVAMMQDPAWDWADRKSVV